MSPLISVAFAMLLYCPKPTQADQSVTLTWNASPDTNAIGYVLYYGTVSGNYDSRLDVGTNTASSVTNLIPGQAYYFVVTAYDYEGVESEPSNEVTFVVPGILLLTIDPLTGLPHIRFPLAVGQACEVQFSTNLLTWSSLTNTLSLVNTWVEFVDLQILPPSRRFYRLRFLN